MRFIPLLLLNICLASLCTPLTAAVLSSGPMISHLSAREARIWMQWEYTPRNPSLQYSNPAEPEKVFVKNISSDEHGISVITLDRVEPGRTYTYSIIENGTPVVDSLFTAPIHYKDIQQPPEFSIAVMGNHYVMEKGAEPPYQELGGHYEVFNDIKKQDVSGVIWAGNSAYMRDMDANGYTSLMRRYGHNRSHPASREILSRVWNKATPGLSNFSAQHVSPTQINEVWARAAFSKFWPSASEFHQKDAATTPLYHSFRWVDTEFFLLDTISERRGFKQKSIPATVFSEEQINWLLHQLSESDAAFKVIVSSLPLFAPNKNPLNFEFADRQKETFVRTLLRNRIDGLVFISGGKHYGELTKAVQPKGYNLFELSVGSTTYMDPDNPKESNFSREPLSYSEAPQYGKISVSGDEGERTITLSLIETSGKVITQRSITQSELRWKEDAF